MSARRLPRPVRASVAASISLIPSVRRFSRKVSAKRTTAVSKAADASQIAVSLRRM